MTSITNVFFFLHTKIIKKKTYILGDQLTFCDLREEEQRFMTLLRFLVQISKKDFYMNPAYIFEPMMACIYNEDRLSFYESIQKMDRLELHLLKTLLLQNSTLLNNGTFPKYSNNR